MRAPVPPAFLVPFGNPLNGGLMFCQDPECDCVHTWAVQGQAKVTMPPPHAAAAWRAIVHQQGGPG